MPQPPARAFLHKDLPPSVESAYYRKCIDLRRRITDIEENNDGTRLRITRLNRGIQKMRLERVFLLEQLNRHMEYTPDDSDRSSSPPPTPTDKPLRSKRSHNNRKGSPPADADADVEVDAEADGGDAAGLEHGNGARQARHSPDAALPHALLHAMNPMSSAQSTPDPSRLAGSTSYFASGAPAAGTEPHVVNGTPVLPPLSSLQMPTTTSAATVAATSTPAPRAAFFDPAYDDQQSQPTTTTTTAPPPQNGDTEMAD